MRALQHAPQYAPVPMVPIPMAPIAMDLIREFS